MIRRKQFINDFQNSPKIVRNFHAQIRIAQRNAQGFASMLSKP